MTNSESSGTSGRVFRRNQWLLLFLGIYLVLSVLIFDVRLFTGGDNVVYMILAESIVSGRGYRDAHMLEEPLHTKYPFGFPLLLSALMLVFGTNIIAFKTFVLLTGCFSIFFAYRIYEHFFGPRANVVMPLHITIPLLLEYNHWILTEIPFLCLSLIAIYCVIKAEKGLKHMYYIAFVVVIIAFFVRTAGISLVFALLIYLLIKKKYAFFGIFLVLFLGAAVPWFLRNARIPESRTYVEQFLLRNPYWMESGRIGVRHLLIRIWNNFVSYALEDIPAALLALIRSAWVYGITGFFFLVSAIIGFVRRMRCVSVIALYCVLSTIIIFCWPEVWISARFFIPLLPFLLIYLYTGWLWVEKAVRFRNLALILVIIIVALNFAAIVMRIEPRINRNIKYLKGEKYTGYPSDWQHYFEAITWIDKNFPDSAIVMARKPEFVYFISGNKTISYPYTDDRADIQRLVERADCIILDNFKWSKRSKAFLKPVIVEMVEHLTFVYKTDKPVFYVVKVRH